MARGGWLGWLRNWLGRGGSRDELDEEIETHIALRSAELIRAGESPERARARAEARFGDPQARRRLRASARRRDARLGVIRILEAGIRDLGGAFRQARRSPGHATIVTLTFALGIGLTTTMFTLVDRVLIRNLPLPDPTRLVWLLSMDSVGQHIRTASAGNWHDWRERNATLSATALLSPHARQLTVLTDGRATLVPGRSVTGSFFATLQLRMGMGRSFTEAEAVADAPVAVVSEAFWRTRLGGDPTLARAITVDGRSRRVVGVIPAGREFPPNTAVWLPVAPHPYGAAARNNISWIAVGRLKPAVTRVQAAADLSAIARGINERDPGSLYSYGVAVAPLRDLVVAGAGRFLWRLLAAVGFLLLIACANIAALTFARARERLQELAVRAALGASRARIAWQLLTEQLTLALGGGVLGVVLSGALARYLVAHFGDQIPRAGEIRLDGGVLLFVLVTSLLAGLLAGVAPVLSVSRTAPRTHVLGGGRGTVRGGDLAGAMLLRVQVALTVVLLVGGGLLLRSYRALLDRNLGYDTDPIATADIALTSPRYQNDRERATQYWDDLLTQLRTLPGVSSAAAARSIPTGDAGRTFIEVAGSPDGGNGATYNVITEDYFETLGIPLLAGRFFRPGDADAERVAIVNQAMARRFWPGESPLGGRVRALSMEWTAQAPAPWLTVVGVVGDVRPEGFESAPTEAMYVFYRQAPYPPLAMSLVVRGKRTGAALVPGIRRAIRTQDPDVAAQVRSLDARLGDALKERRFILSGFGTFGALALLLASLGLYGVLSLAVARRRPEIGVRAALGARSHRLVSMVVRRALRIVLLGLIVGLAGAYGLTRLLSSMLVDVQPTDRLTYIGVALLLLAVSFLAAAIPAWRATRVDPLDALRSL